MAEETISGKEWKNMKWGGTFEINVTENFLTKIDFFQKRWKLLQNQ